MRARHILQSGAFTPEHLERLQSAFDAAWKKIAPSIVEADHHRSRELLASVVVSAGKVSDLDAGELAMTAERLFQDAMAGERS
ncbi:hypothetical protein [Hyphomicrobium sp.]|uniref:hypothetical protein n=1 Tax=Hyphomicrobium sp. TaxID=82 RepID=UPI002D78BF4C|nr:hypothetical protein [Hyphomicrobium sp.]HET6389848.1 hypothetical protein [Hyphomicrobium sp.]